MKQFVLNFECGEESGTFYLSKEEYNYLINVRRLLPGTKVKALDQGNRQLELEILGVDKGQAQCRWEIVREAKPSQRLEKVLIFSLLKGKKNEDVIRQAVETGVTRIIPVIAEFSVSQPSRDSFSKKLEKWQTVIKQAVQQSGRPEIPQIENIVRLSEIKELLKDDYTGIFFHHKDLNNNEVVKEISADKAIVFAIGPEGGFSDKEIAFFEDIGFKPVFLATPIMKAETAAVAASIMITTIASEKKN